MRFDRSKVFLGQFGFPPSPPEAGRAIDRGSADVARLIPISFTLPPFPGTTSGCSRPAQMNIRSLKDDLVGDVRAVLLLTGTIGVVLLIACAKWQTCPGKSRSRQQELAIRAALGAGTGRIARELLTESMVLGVLGGLVGLALAWGALRVLVALAPGNLPRLDEIMLDMPVLAFTLVISVAAVCSSARSVFQCAGGRVARRFAPVDARPARAASVVAPQRARRRQVALAVVLLVCAGLMIRTFQALRNVDPGFVRPAEVRHSGCSFQTRRSEGRSGRANGRRSSTRWQPCPACSPSRSRRR
jgi:hypothetical protein